jgi:PAS domain-containing protein
MLHRLPSSAWNQGSAGSGIQTRSVSAAVGRPDGQRPFQLGPCFARAGARRRGHRRRFARLSRYSALHLENNLARNVFFTTRIAVLELHASQAATAVENFRLYRDLAARETKIRRLVDANIISIMVADDGGQIVEANDAFLRMSGYDREALDSGRIRRTEMTPPEWRDRTAQV